MTAPLIRPVALHELDQLLALYQHLHPTDAPLPARDELDALWRRILADPQLHYLVAEVDGQLVASCTLAVIANLTRGARPYAVVENVVTHAAFRRRGVAKALLRDAIARAWQAGCYKVMLLSGTEREAAHTLYESIGFARGTKVAFVIKRD